MSKSCTALLCNSLIRELLCQRTVILPTFNPQVLEVIEKISRYTNHANITSSTKTWKNFNYFVHVLFLFSNSEYAI